MMNFFHTLLHPDHEDDLERAQIARAANLLQVGEFQLLQLAYNAWFGRDIPSENVNNLFKSYMFHNEVPHWARHYARRIFALDKSGMLNDLDLRYQRYDSDYRVRAPQGVIRFCAMTAIVVFFLGGMLLLSHMIAQKGGSILPPYFEREEIPPPASPLRERTFHPKG